MDPDFANEIVTRRSEFYHELLQEGEEPIIVSDMLYTNMLELAPECERYMELERWGKRYLQNFYVDPDPDARNTNKETNKS